MASKDKVQGIIYNVRREDFRECICKEIVVVSERLYIPSCTPDIRPIRHSVRGLCTRPLPLVVGTYGHNLYELDFFPDGSFGALKAIQSENPSFVIREGAVADVR